MAEKCAELDPEIGVQQPGVLFRFTGWFGPWCGAVVKYAKPYAPNLDRDSLDFLLTILKYAILKSWRCHGAGRLGINTTIAAGQHCICWYHYVGFARRIDFELNI